MVYDNVVSRTHAYAGGTFYIDGRPVNTERGFAVGGFVPEKSISAEHFDALDVNNFVDRNIDKLSQPGLYLGAWVEDDHVVLSVCAVIGSQDIAIAAARGLNQRAVYDFRTRKSIPTY